MIVKQHSILSEETWATPGLTDKWLSSVYDPKKVLWFRSEESERSFCKHALKLKNFCVDFAGEKEFISRARVRPAGDRPDPSDVMTIQFPTMLDEWGLAGRPDYEVVEAINAYASKFGVEPIFKPSGTGLRALRQDLAFRGKLAQLEPPLGGYEPFEKRPANALYWCRSLTVAELNRFGRKSIYVHCIDKKASYLHACDTPMGVGDWQYEKAPERHDGGAQGWLPEIIKTPGVWRIEGIVQPHLPFEVDLSQWYYTPTLRALAALGAHFRVMEGYYYPESAPVFRHWRQQMIDSLQGADDFPAFRGMLKSTYTKMFGLLRSKQFAGAGYRPDHGNLIISEAWARIAHNIAKVRDLCGAEPIAVYDDGLYYLSASPDHCVARTAVASDQRLSDKFKDGGVYDFSSEEARELLTSIGGFIQGKKRFQLGGVK